MSENVKHVPSVEFLATLDVVESERIGKRVVFYLEDPDYRISIGDCDEERIVHYKNQIFTMEDYDEEDRKCFTSIIYALFLCAAMDKLCLRKKDHA